MVKSIIIPYFYFQMSFEIYFILLLMQWRDFLCVAGKYYFVLLKRIYTFLSIDDSIILRNNSHFSISAKLLIKQLKKIVVVIVESFYSVV